MSFEKYARHLCGCAAAFHENETCSCGLNEQKNKYPKGGSYVYKYPMQSVTGDAVVISNDNGTEEVLLIKRNTEPFKGCLALPGGHLDPTDADTCETAIRELKEETGIDYAHKSFPKYHICSGYVGTYSKIDRDPRGRYVTSAYYFYLNDKPEIDIQEDEVQSFEWVNVNDLDEVLIAFDHRQIIQDALKTINHHALFTI
jgi:ADP-ribose pyrophosphatase YjhB (NUDIX family)